MIKKLQDHINRFQTTSLRPVSFLFHCEIGIILSNDDENLTEMEQYDKVLSDSNEITFIS